MQNFIVITIDETSYIEHHQVFATSRQAAEDKVIDSAATMLESIKVFTTKEYLDKLGMFY